MSGGLIHINRALPQESQFEIILNCMYSHAGNNRSSHPEVRWQKSQIVLSQSDLSESTINFKIPVVEGQPASESTDDHGFYYWSLVIRSINSKINLTRRYNIPVYKLDEPLYADVEIHRIAEAIETTAYPISQSQENGLSLKYPMFRNLYSKLIPALAGAIFLAFANTFISSYNDLSALLAMDFAIVSALFALIGLLLLSYSIYRLGSAYQIDVDMAGLQRTRRWLIFRSTRHFSITKISGFRKKEGFKTWHNGQMRIFYQIQLIDSHGKATAIGDAIPSEKNADQVIKQLEAVLNGATTEDDN